MDYYKNKILEYKEYIAGSASGVTRTIIGYPIETIKIRTQISQQTNFTQLNIKNLYKGSTFILFGSLFTTSIEFGIYNNYKKKSLNDDISNYLLAGGFSGLCQVPIVTPIEHVRNKLQILEFTDNSKIGFKQMFSQIIKTHGIKKLYRGTFLTTIRDTIGTALYFCSYELGKKHIKINNKSYVTDVISGVIAGTIYWMTIYPIDLVKNNIQVDKLNKPIYSNSCDCVKKIYFKDGFNGFYKGFTPCVLRSIPVHIAMFSTYKYITDAII